MAASHRAPKQWALGKVEDVNSFENWRQNLLYTLSLDKAFTPFLADAAKWNKKTKADPNRGFTDDTGEGEKLTAAQKVHSLELMLGQIANFCPVLSRNTIVKNSTSLPQIWQAIRLHFGFQSSGGHFIDFSSIQLKCDERPEDLYQRLMAFIEDNLLRQDGGITHHGSEITEDEELTPSLENMIVLTWLGLLHKDLPKLVKQRYGTELRSRTLASIKPEISQALDTLLDEIRCAEDAKVMRTSTSQFQPHTHSGRPRSATPFSKVTSTRYSSQKSRKTCPLCKQTGRADFNHFLSECEFLPPADKKYMTKVRQITGIIDGSDDCSEPEDLPEYQEPAPSNPASVLRVQVRQSPYMDTFFGYHPARLTIDSGATGNMIRVSTAKALGADIRKSTQLASQADGRSQLTVVGETRMIFVRDGREFPFEGLVVEDLDVEILAGTPFMEKNDITIRPRMRQVILDDGSIVEYGRQAKEPTTPTVRRAHVMRAPPKPITIWPGEFVELDIPPDYSNDGLFAMEPRTDAPGMKNVSDANIWPLPSILPAVARQVRIPNLTTEPKVLKKNEQFCQISPVYTPNTAEVTSIPHTIPKIDSSQGKFSSKVIIDPSSTLPDDTKKAFEKLLLEFDEVFNPMSGGYNGAVGPFKAVVNMGPVQPPQRKGRLPQYSRNKLVELQQKCDELEALGVFKRPEDIGVTVEYVNPSFLVKKSSGGFRLVTAFADVGRYSKPQPSLMPDVDSTLRLIAQWQHVIVSDLSNAFYQIPLSPESYKYCGIVTPFRGVRVYVRSAMGMPGSETALEELMCRVLGDLLQEGVVAKLADDLYCGGNSPQELLQNWTRVLEALHTSGLCLSASKTIINPRSTTILGWTWQSGTITASPHRISTLSSCSPPVTVKGMRSFIGAYKVLSRVLPRCSSILAPLDEAVAGRQSKDKIQWSDSLHTSFTEAQTALMSNHTIVLPRADDQLWIVTDGAVKNRGIGATLYVYRGDKLRLAGFFSAKLPKSHANWLPCEIEALSIGMATRHFSPYIIQSEHHTCILTDSKPCVQAYEKLCRGKFSSSPRVSTFISTVSRFQASVRHIAGTANVPSDHASRNAPDCNEDTCQVCSFVSQSEESVVRRTSTQDVLTGNAKLPYTSRSTWLAIQSECDDLRRTHAHLVQGTRPSKKQTNVTDVKRYLNVATIARDKLLVVKRHQPFAPSRECIVVPRQVVDGLVTSLHVQLDHPTSHQLKSVVHRYFYALDLDKVVDRTTSGCHQCTALRNTPKCTIPQSSNDPPEAVGIMFAADIAKRERQLILVLRECATSYTVSCLVDNEQHETLRDALICLCIDLRPLDGPPAVIRTDPAPGFMALRNDEVLQKHRISIEVGRVKNKNKNPVAEKAIRELLDELLRQDPRGGKTTRRNLAVATARLNSRIRSRGLSSREMWTHRDQFTSSQIPVSDLNLILEQHQSRLANHQYSARSKAPSALTMHDTQVAVGDLVYLYTDRSKSQARNRYLVVSVEGEWCNIKKFVGQQLRATSYRVKRSECYKVPQYAMDLRQQIPFSTSEDLSDDESQAIHLQPPEPPDIPSQLSTPAQPVELVDIPLHDQYDHPDSTQHEIQDCSTGMDVSDQQLIVKSQASQETLSNEDVPMTRQSARSRKAPAWHKDYEF